MSAEKEIAEKRLRLENDERVKMLYEQKKETDKNRLAVKEKEDSRESRIRKFGDLLKNVMVPMPQDVLDIPVYFDSVDRIFNSNTIPADIQTVLLNPYLSDKARRLVIRLPIKETNDYPILKAPIL